MALYALVDGDFQPVTKLGARATCVDDRCAWPMIAKPGNGKNMPHWAHAPGSRCAKYPATGEKGEWHREVQNTFCYFGAQQEVQMRSADGLRDHYADVVCADGRIVEAQTHYLEVEQTTSREATYCDMAWLYDCRDHAAWFIVENGDPARFRWGKANRRFFAHSKPVFFDCHEDGIWKLDWMQHKKGAKGRVYYEGLRHKVAADLLEFVQLVVSGKSFGAAPRLSAIDVKKNRTGTSRKRMPSAEEWFEDNQTCEYLPPEEPEPQRAPVYIASVPDYTIEEIWAMRFAAKTHSAPVLPNPWAGFADTVPAPPPQPVRPPLPPAEETDWSQLAGMTCRCRPDCTDQRWGDAGTCADNCEPCRIMAGTTYTKPNRKRASA